MHEAPNLRNSAGYTRRRRKFANLQKKYIFVISWKTPGELFCFAYALSCEILGADWSVAESFKFIKSAIAEPLRCFSVSTAITYCNTPPIPGELLPLAAKSVSVVCSACRRAGKGLLSILCYFFDFSYIFLAYNVSEYSDIFSFNIPLVIYVILLDINI